VVGLGGAGVPLTTGGAETCAAAGRRKAVSKRSGAKWRKRERIKGSMSKGKRLNGALETA
jgi:hypothetical protein